MVAFHNSIAFICGNTVETRSMNNNNNNNNNLLAELRLVGIFVVKYE